MLKAIGIFLLSILSLTRLPFKDWKDVLTFSFPFYSPSIKTIAQENGNLYFVKLIILTLLSSLTNPLPFFWRHLLSLPNFISIYPVKISLKLSLSPPINPINNHRSLFHQQCLPSNPATRTARYPPLPKSAWNLSRSTHGMKSLLLIWLSRVTFDAGDYQNL